MTHYTDQKCLKCCTWAMKDLVYCMAFEPVIHIRERKKHKCNIASSTCVNKFKSKRNNNPTWRYKAYIQQNHLSGSLTDFKLIQLTKNIEYKLEYRKTAVVTSLCTFQCSEVNIRNIPIPISYQHDVVVTPPPILILTLCLRWFHYFCVCCLKSFSLYQVLK